LAVEYRFGLNTRPKPTDRIEKLINYVNSIEPGICLERARYITQVYKENEYEPIVMKRAKSLKKILENMSIYIMPGSLFVGNQASKPRWAPLFPEYEVKWYEEEMISGDPIYPWERPADAFKIENKKESLKEAQEIFDWWRGKTHRQKVYNNLPEEFIIVQDKVSVLNIWDYIQGGVGHFSPGHKWLIKNGLNTVIETAEEKLRGLGFSSSEELKKREFYKSVILSCEAVVNFARRYAELARNMARQEADDKRQQELLRIAKTCEHLPANPARSFYEALQFIYFIHLVVQIEDSGQGISVGRFDQILWDYYKNDRDNKILTSDEALEMIENFFIMIYTINKVKSWDCTDYFRGSPMFQNLTVGGQDPVTQGDATNELTYLVLEATANTRLTQPSVTARFHKKSPEEYKLAVAKVIRVGTGFPAVFNDELYIPALINRGYEINDAYNYCIIGCAEAGPAGLLAGRTGGAWLNLPKILELTLYNGKDPLTGIQLRKNKNDKDLSEFISFEEFLNVFYDQLDYYLKMEVAFENIIDHTYEQGILEPFSSIAACPETSLERGKTLREGGGKYDFTGQQTIGIANVSNSLYAIKKLVFDDKVLTSAQLFHAILTDFSDKTTNPSGLEINKILESVDKYGNDVDEVDFLARDVLRFVSLELPKYKNTRYKRGPIGCTMHASTTTVSSNVAFGKSVGAMPSGRRKGKPLSDGQSPMRGTDVKGPTAAVNSVSKLNNILLSCGSLYNLKFNPKDLRLAPVLKGREELSKAKFAEKFELKGGEMLPKVKLKSNEEGGLRKFVGLVDHYFASGGMQMQFNMVSKETLLDAQKHPERYKDLLVRVAGYSAYFIQLAKEVQEDIIGRTEERL